MLSSLALRVGTCFWLHLILTRGILTLLQVLPSHWMEGEFLDTAQACMRVEVQSDRAPQRGFGFGNARWKTVFRCPIPVRVNCDPRLKEK